MRINGTIISSAKVLEGLKCAFTGVEFVEGSGKILAVANKKLTFDPNALHQMNSKLTSAGYDQFSLRINTDGIITIVDGTQLEQDLAKWVDAEGGKAQEAADKIKTAFYTSASSLDLAFLGLRTLPKSILSQLPNLRNLNLSRNQLTDLELPDTYTNLRNLDVAYNKLKALKLPDTYTNLRNLNVAYNKLTALKLPDTLSKFETLDVSCNQLKTLKLSRAWMNLEILNASENQLKALKLPDTYNNLKNLYASRNQLTAVKLSDALPKFESLDVSRNPSLSILPLLLIQCCYLTRINATDTLISPKLVNLILAACLAIRSAEGAQNLSKRLEVWSAAANNQFDFSFIIKDFSQEEIESVSKWLLRLEYTNDINSYYQQELALTVCQMVLSLNTDGQFKEQFFAQVNANLEQCGDRAAMSFNEIFLAWKLRSLVNSKSEDKEQLKLMIATAKTLTLRKAIAEKCAEKSGQGESAEIYLYYELALREKLNLLTAIHEMSHSLIGKREWINEEELEGHVNANYLEALCDLPSFKEMAGEDSSLAWLLGQATEKFQEQLAELEQERKEEGEWLAQCTSLQSKYNREMNKILEKWARERILRMGLVL